MTLPRKTAVASSMPSFTFESYGVTVRLRSNLPAMLAKAESVARVSLLGNVSVIGRKNVDLDIELIKEGRTYLLRQNGEYVADGTSSLKFFKYFDSVIRASVGENAPELVFLHGGVVGWKGKAIVLPADSFKGKSTIVAELVRQGATYLSDDFALFDKDGSVHAFARPISMRTDAHREYRLSGWSFLLNTGPEQGGNPGSSHPETGPLR
jgi:hypothetical protein